tara:strand:- start:691 stop:1005 length:315 start_codon:yes stop_codon:yes gene_type:complete
MGFKDFFKFTKITFILLVIFNVFGNLSVLRLSGMFGKSVGAGLFDLFSYFNQFTCVKVSIVCGVWDAFLGIAILVLNLVWQLFLANLVLMVYQKIKNNKNKELK